MKRFAAAAVMLTMGLFLAGCDKPAPPKTTTPAINPADAMKNMPKTPGTDEKKTEGAAPTDGKTDPAEPDTDAPKGDAPESTEDKKDGDEKKDE